jgi:osmoprotectant transport system permease protein
LEVQWDWIARHRTDIAWSAFDHAELTLMSVVIAAALAIPLAILVRNSSVATASVLGLTGVLYTIPSIVLFGMLVPVVGLGSAPVVIGLVLYSLLTLVRNTLTGLEQVPSSAREAAIGLGMTPRQLLLRLELPLAAPGIIAGLRVATVAAVGIATIGGLVGAGGLGQVIVDGVRQDFPTMIVAGAAATTALAVVLDGVLVLALRAAQPWRRSAA